MEPPVGCGSDVSASAPDLIGIKERRHLDSEAHQRAHDILPVVVGADPTLTLTNQAWHGLLIRNLAQISGPGIVADPSCRQSARSLASNSKLTNRP